MKGGVIQVNREVIEGIELFKEGWGYSGLFK